MNKYALMLDGQVDSLYPSVTWWDGERWWDFRDGDPATFEAAGWLPITDEPRPPDTDTETSDYAVVAVDGLPVGRWTVRPWSVDELHEQEVARLQLEKDVALAALTPTETNALLAATTPPSGAPWRQPTGAHDAYPLGAIVTHRAPPPVVPNDAPPVQYAEVPWESLLTANVWEPGVSGWRETGVEWPAWVQPAGSHDSYGVGSKVSHNGARWTSEVDSNVWEPGVYGWVEQVDGG